MAMAELENKAGKFVAPSLAASKKALAAAKLPADMRAWVTDPEGDDVYPIVTYTWILAKKKYDDAAKAGAVKQLLTWCLTDGQKLSEQLNYVRLPEAVTQQVLQAVNTIH
jgi:phosphate transport system substrate-binding protein